MNVESMANKFKSDSLVEIAQILLTPNSKFSVPPLKTNDQTYAEECEKENTLNDFFKDDLRNAEIPDIPSHPVVCPLNNIVYFFRGS